MNVLTYNPDAMTKFTVIPLGRACECRATRIDFAVGSWLNRFPGGVIALYIKDPNGEAYLATVTTENGVASWVLSNTDTQVSGYGSLELALIGENGERKLSAVATTKIDPSLVEDELVERPEYMQPWIERAAEIQAATETAANQAYEHRNAAYAATGSAAGFAAAAKDSATKAAESAEAVKKYMDENQIGTDATLTLENGILSVNTADVVEENNTLPVTSAAVHAQIGNINALLATI